jgi:hypothetical protein
MSEEINLKRKNSKRLIIYNLLIFLIEIPLYASFDVVDYNFGILASVFLSIIFIVLHLIILFKIFKLPCDKRLKYTSICLISLLLITPFATALFIYLGSLNDKFAGDSYSLGGGIMAAVAIMNCGLLLLISTLLAWMNYLILFVKDQTRYFTLVKYNLRCLWNYPCLLVLLFFIVGFNSFQFGLILLVLDICFLFITDIILLYKKRHYENLPIEKNN